jgi:hypothetical protein
MMCHIMCDKRNFDELNLLRYIYQQQSLSLFPWFANNFIFNNDENMSK